MKAISVCYVLSYYSPDYVRTRTLVEALRRIEGVTVLEARNRTTGIARYAETLWKLLAIRMLHHPDVYVLGFRGYELYCAVRLLTAGRPLILDHMMSPYDSLVNESRRVKKHGIGARLIYIYERAILMGATRAITDTEMHREYFVALFGLPPSRIAAIPVGTDEALFAPRAAPRVQADPAMFEVLYYGSLLPLHGIDIILDAASFLRDEPVHFTLIGGDDVRILALTRAIQRLDLHNVTHLRWVDFEALPEHINRADLGLGGPFGNTGQARRVITSKTFQFLAMAQPVVVGATDQDGGFVNQLNCLLVPQGDARLLAAAISWGAAHRAELREIGRRGRELYYARYCIDRIAEGLKEVLQ